MDVESLRLMLNMLYDNMDVYKSTEISNKYNNGFLIIKASSKSLRLMIMNNPHEYPSYDYFKYYLLVNKDTNKISNIYRNIEYDIHKKQYICIGTIDDKDKISIDILDKELNIISQSFIISDEALNDISIHMKYRVININNNIFTFNGKLLNNFRFDDNYRLLIDNNIVTSEILKSKQYLEVVNQ